MSPQTFDTFSLEKNPKKTPENSAQKVPIRWALDTTP